MWNWFLAQVGIFDSTLAFMSSLFSVTVSSGDIVLDELISMRWLKQH